MFQDLVVIVGTAFVGFCVLVIVVHTVATVATNAVLDAWKKHGQ